MGVKAGYKQTEIGVIPEDWEVKRIGDFTDCTAGGTPSTKVPNYWGGNIRWMSSGELHLKEVDEVEGRITEEGLRNSSTKIVPENCILIGLAGQGKTRGTVAINRTPLCTNQSIAAIFPNKSFVPKYLFHNLNSRYKQFRELSSGEGGRGGLNLTLIKSMYVSLPPSLTEQTAIATALSNADALIQSLERLIAKKRDIKQGAMQELLTGKKRLPGFEGEWEEKTISGVSSKLKAGGTPPRTVKKFWRGTIPFVLIEDITSSNKYLSKTEEYITYIGLKNSSTWIVPKDSILLSMYASLGELVINRIEVATNQAIIAIIPKESYDLDFLYYNLKFNKLLFEKLVSQTTQKNLNKEKVSNFEIKFPIKKQEQTAIATVLSDMDAEIATLDSKLTKSRQIKQGMMQELLTGRIRLT